MMPGGNKRECQRGRNGSGVWGESLGEKSENRDKIENHKKRQKREEKVTEQILDEQGLTKTCPGGVVDVEAPAEVKTWANLREKERNQSILQFLQQPNSKVAKNGASKGGRAEKVWDLDNPRGKWGAGGPESENSNQGVSQDTSKRSL